MNKCGQVWSSTWVYTTDTAPPLVLETALGGRPKVHLVYAGEPLSLFIVQWASMPCVGGLHCPTINIHVLMPITVPSQLNKLHRNNMAMREHLSSRLVEPYDTLAEVWHPLGVRRSPRLRSGEQEVSERSTIIFRRTEATGGSNAEMELTSELFEDVSRAAQS